MLSLYRIGHRLKKALLLPSLMLFLAGCNSTQMRSDVEPLVGNLAAMLQGVELGSDQVLVVIGSARLGADAQVYALERTGRSWTQRMGPLTASVGRNGFAPPGEKREGDGKSPTGLFPLESAFGYAPTCGTKMPYRQATEQDVWVDDPKASDYNTWVRKLETAAASFEPMKLGDIRYRHGIVIGYNRNPVVKGMGSAIFMHAWLELGKPTAGCVTLEEDHLVHILEWLDPARKPKILMGTLDYFTGLTGLAEWRAHEVGRSGTPKR